MSVRRLVATMDTNGVNVREFCEQHGMSRDRFYLIRRRYAAEGEAGVAQRSRAPKTVANKTSLLIEEQIVRVRKELVEDGLDAGPVTIEWHLQRQGVDPIPSKSTIWRILKARGFIVDDPTKAPVRANKSFEAARANEVWQIDGTGWELADGTPVKIINVIDDGSRLCPASQAHKAESLDAAWSTFLAGASEWGMPARFLSDNGRAFRALEQPLGELGISMGHSRPYHPQTCGKVERFHQTMKKWLAAQDPAQTITELQTLVDQFRRIYNHDRPHRAIGRQVPADRWADMAKSGPKDRPLDLTIQTIGDRTVTDNGIISFGRNRISLGTAHAANTATVIASQTHVHIFIGTKLIRHLELAADTNAYPIYNQIGRPRKPQ